MALPTNIRKGLGRIHPATVLLGGTLVAGFVLRAWLATHDDGIYWPDEIHQSLEPAHRLVFGQGLLSWEFVAGARSWVFPGLVALPLKLWSLTGLTDPHLYILTIRLLFCMVGIATAVGCYRLAKAFDSSALSAAAGAALFALMAPAIYFAPRAMSETASALLIVFGLTLSLAHGSRRLGLIAGTALLGIAVSFRLQNVIFAVFLLAILAGRRDWQRLSVASTVLAGCALLIGFLDLATWGSLFHSAIAYLRYNLTESAQYGVSPFWYYGRVAFTAIGPLAVAMLLLILVAWRRAPGLFLLAAGYVLAHSLVAHKDVRFLLPVLPVLCALTAVGIDVIASTGRRWLFRATMAVTVGLGMLSALTFHHLTFGDLGAYEDSRPAVSAYDDSGPVNRLLLAAHGRRDLCGLKIESVKLGWSGGYSYLDRSVPLYPPTGPGDDAELYNYVITASPAGPGRIPIARDGPEVLARLPNSGCRPDPSSENRVPT